VTTEFDDEMGIKRTSLKPPWQQKCGHFSSGYDRPNWENGQCFFREETTMDCDVSKDQVDVRVLTRGFRGFH